MRIRSRLVLLVASVLVPALVGAGIGLAFVYEEEQAFHRASMRQTAHAFALALEREMARRESVLRTLADSPVLRRGELALFHEFASAVARENDAAIILSDLEGRQIINTRLPIGSRLPRMLPEERENRVRLGDEVTIISDLYTPPAGLGPHSFAIQIPVRRDGKVAQFLTMAAFASQLQALLGERSLPEGWHASILDRQGRVVARSELPGKFVGAKVQEALTARIASQLEGFFEGDSLAGVRSSTFFSRAPGSGWTFLLTVPQALLHGPANRTLAWMAAIGLALLALAVAGAFAVARRIARPVEALRASAERLGRNEPVGAAPTGTVELDAVGEAMAAASERLRGATAELERRVAESVARFEQSQRALVQAQKLEALGRLTGGIAHDFNNVLQTLTAGLEALRHGARGGQRELIERCQRAVERGTGVARQLMAFGRVQEVRTETIDTAARLADARALLAGVLPSNVTLAYDVAPELWPVTVDPAQLELALLNLVINARDAMRGSGTVSLAARNHTVAVASAELHAGDYVLISVLDTGEGMDEAVMARALDPFYTTKGAGRGSGMGLPQAYGFARQNGGSLTLESRVGEGTTVRLYLPRATKPVSKAPSTRPAAALPVGRGKILLVEDDEHVRETVSLALQAAGFEVHTAASGDEARQRVDRGERYDALFTDVVMPGALSGLDLAEHVLKHYPGTGVVVATGYSDRPVSLLGVRALAKPYDVQQAVEALCAATAARS